MKAIITLLRCPTLITNNFFESLTMDAEAQILSDNQEMFMQKQEYRNNPFFLFRAKAFEDQQAVEATTKEDRIVNKLMNEELQKRSNKNYTKKYRRDSINQSQLRQFNRSGLNQVQDEQGNNNYNEINEQIEKNSEYQSQFVYNTKKELQDVVRQYVQKMGIDFFEDEESAIYIKKNKEEEQIDKLKHINKISSPSSTAFDSSRISKKQTNMEIVKQSLTYQLQESEYIWIQSYPILGSIFGFDDIPQLSERTKRQRSARRIQRWYLRQKRINEIREMLKQQQSMRKEGEKLSKEAEAYFEQKRGSISSQSSVNDMKRNDSVIAKLMIGEGRSLFGKQTQNSIQNKLKENITSHTTLRDLMKHSFSSQTFFSMKSEFSWSASPDSPMSLISEQELENMLYNLKYYKAAQIIQRETRAYLARKMAVGRQLMVAHAFRRRKQQLWNYRITYIASCTPQLSRIDMRKILVEQQEQNIKNLSDLIKQACLERKRIIITSIPRTLLPQFQTVVNQLETEFGPELINSKQQNLQSQNNLNFLSKKNYNSIPSLAVRDQGERKLLMGREWIPQYNPITNERVYLNVRTGEETHVHPQLKYLQNETEDSLKHTDYLYNQTSEMISSFSQWMMSDMQKSRKQSIDICLISFCEQFSKYLDTQKRSIERQLQKPPQKKKDGILKLKFGKNMSNQGSNIGTPSKLSDRSDKSAHTYSNRSGNNSPENPLENQQQFYQQGIKQINTVIPQSSSSSSFSSNVTFFTTNQSSSSIILIQQQQKQQQGSSSVLMGGNNKSNSQSQLQISQVRRWSTGEADDDSLSSKSNHVIGHQMSSKLTLSMDLSTEYSDHSSRSSSPKNRRNSVDSFKPTQDKQQILSSDRQISDQNIIEKQVDIIIEDDIDKVWENVSVGQDEEKYDNFDLSYVDIIKDITDVSQQNIPNIQKLHIHQQNLDEQDRRGDISKQFTLNQKQSSKNNLNPDPSKSINPKKSSVSIQSEYLIKPNPGPLFLPQPNKLIPHNVKVIDRETGSAFIPTYSMIRNIEIILWGDQKRVRKQHKEEHIGRRFWKHLVRSRFNELNDILNDSEVFRIQNDIEAEMEWREEEIAFAEFDKMRNEDLQEMKRNELREMEKYLIRGVKKDQQQQQYNADQIIHQQQHTDERNIKGRKKSNEYYEENKIQEQEENEYEENQQYIDSKKSFHELNPQEFDYFNNSDQIVGTLTENNFQKDGQIKKVELASSLKYSPHQSQIDEKNKIINLKSSLKQSQIFKDNEQIEMPEINMDYLSSMDFVDVTDQQQFDTEKDMSKQQITYQTSRNLRELEREQKEKREQERIQKEELEEKTGMKEINLNYLNNMEFEDQQQQQSQQYQQKYQEIEFQTTNPEEIEDSENNFFFDSELTQDDTKNKNINSLVHIQQQKNQDLMNNNISFNESNFDLKKDRYSRFKPSEQNFLFQSLITNDNLQQQQQIYSDMDENQYDNIFQEGEYNNSFDNQLQNEQNIKLPNQNNMHKPINESQMQQQQQQDKNISTSYYDNFNQNKMNITYEGDTNFNIENEVKYQQGFGQKDESNNINSLLKFAGLIDEESKEEEFTQEEESDDNFWADLQQDG